MTKWAIVSSVLTRGSRFASKHNLGYNHLMKICLWDECSNETKNPKFCSISCGTKYQRRYHDVFKKNYPDKECLECGKVFNINSKQIHKVFCSRSCAVKHNNRLRKSKPVDNQCGRCGKPCRNKFCSTYCSAKYRGMLKVNLWLAGEWDGTSTIGLAPCIRKYLIKEANNKCTSPTCSVPGGFKTIHPVTGNVPLEVDHLDGNCYNNTRENLMVVCPNCHALTSNYKSLNRNSGRAYRRSAIVA